MRVGFLIAVAYLILGTVSPASGWDGTEHQFLGTQAYHLACLAVRNSHQQPLPTNIKNRLNIACAQVGGLSAKNGAPFTYEQLMGEWSALAADHTESPDQLTSIRLGDIVVDNRIFSRIVMTNYRHFYPASVTSWRTDHLKALQAAAVAADRSGIEMVEAFEEALTKEAFAQHYLQDSFAAGHMGFNRVASSNAAALTYHDKWSRRGRCVANAKNEAWYTFGDGALGQSQSGASHVVSAAATSMYDLLSTFVDGQTSPVEWQAIWDEFPATYNDYLTAENCVSGQGWPSLRTISMPAEAVVTYEVSTVTDSAIYRPTARGVMAGVSLDSGAFNIGYRNIQTRYFTSVGFTTHQLGGHAFLLDLGQVAHVGTSMRGALTHELGFGELLYYMRSNSSSPCGCYGNVSYRVLYAANIEIGRVFVRLQTGVAHARGSTGPHISMGLGFVKSSRR